MHRRYTATKEEEEEEEGKERKKKYTATEKSKVKTVMLYTTVMWPVGNVAQFTERRGYLSARS